ncbi:hypothetical protein R1flu_017484 [Riccia fluitans]|uniref:Uncharacterized protein n=1 Tax=Riccia fluitans TaxID=41844 RepID=A0ABD1ZFH8_9MARC
MVETLTIWASNIWDLFLDQPYWLSVLSLKPGGNYLVHLTGVAVHVQLCSGQHVQMPQPLPIGITPVDGDFTECHDPHKLPETTAIFMEVSRHCDSCE